MINNPHRSDLESNMQYERRVKSDNNLINQFVYSHSNGNGCGTHHRKFLASTDLRTATFNFKRNSEIRWKVVSSKVGASQYTAILWHFNCVKSKMRTRRSHRSHLQVFHYMALVHKLFNNLHTLQNLIFYPQHRKGYLKLKAMCMMVIVNKMVILYRYDIVNIDKIVNLNDHDSISIRYPRNRQENITETNLICMIQMIANALMI